MIASLVVLALAAAPGGPSFDCAKASSRVERLVCADAELRAADRDLAAAYARAAKPARDGPPLRDDQRAWLARRDACLDRACLAASYRQRAAELARLAAAWGPYAGVVVTCDARANRVVVEGRLLALPDQPAAEIAKAPLGSGRFVLTELDRHADCRLGDGRAVRLKIAPVFGSGFGECGAGSSIDLSLWIDEVPVVSRLEIADRCHRGVLDSLTLAAAGLETCSTWLGADPPVLSPPQCTRKPVAARLGEPDRIEYPTSPGPPEGTIVTAYAADPPLCRSMVVEKRDELGQPAWEVSPPRGSRTRFFPETKDTSYRSDGQEYPGSIRFARFDADNDGALDRVYWLYGERRDFWADMYFVLAPGPALSNDELDETALRERSRLVFPAAWAKTAAAADADDVTAYVVKHQGTASGPLSLLFERLTLKPFALRGTTYFLADTWRQLDPGRTEVVLRPRPKGSADEVCVFTHVSRHM